MTLEDYYGPISDSLQCAEAQLRDMIEQFPKYYPEDLKPIVYYCTRIKSPESMIHKLAELDLDTDCNSALKNTFDAVGLRIICAFTEDVYTIISWLKTRQEFHIIREKDYIAYPKPNGYRSYHLQVWLPNLGLPAEIQVRTIATDFWATLEHQLKYKKDIPHEEVIRSELKRCADEIASVDISMQTLRDIIRTTIGEKKENQP